MQQKYIYLLCLCFPFIGANNSPSIVSKYDFRKGKDYALFFAVNEYDKLHDLQKPIENASAIAKELEENYGFHTEIVINPTYDNIEEKLNEYKDKFAKNHNGEYDSNGQLLIFFSGHGVEENDNGFFLLKDTELGRYHRTAIQYDYWRKYINTIDCKHILVAIDACYSVYFDPSWGSKSGPELGIRPGELSQGEKLWANHNQFTARLFFTSDAKAGETPDRSTFAKKILEGLQSGGGSDGILTSSELFAVIANASPTPHRGEFGDDDAGSSFLFQLENPQGDFSIDIKELDTMEKDLEAWRSAKSFKTIEGFQSYLTKYPNGYFRREAISKLKDLEQKNIHRNENLIWEIAKEKDEKLYYVEYLNKYPEGKYVDKAFIRINELNQPNQKEFLNTWAVIVGIAHYDYFPSLRYTDDDAYQFYAFLRSPEGGALNEKNIRLLIDADATRENIIDSMSKLFLNANQNDRIIFYFSGHGLKDSFLPHDSNGKENRLFHQDIIRIIRKSKANSKLVLGDACHSGGILSENFNINEQYSNFYNSENNVTLIMSSKINEVSFDNEGLRSGVFSKYLIKGLKGEADHDNNRVITIKELYEYVLGKVRAFTNNKQSPIINEKYNEDMIIAKIR